MTENERARELLANGLAILNGGKNWCKSVLAVDRHGRECGVNSLRATSWCAEGALFKAARMAGYEYMEDIRRASDLLFHSAHMVGGPDIPHINDSAKSFQKVRNLYARAIAMAEKGQHD